MRSGVARVFIIHGNKCVYIPRIHPAWTKGEWTCDDDEYARVTRVDDMTVCAARADIHTCATCKKPYMSRVNMHRCNHAWDARGAVSLCKAYAAAWDGMSLRTRTDIAGQPVQRLSKLANGICIDAPGKVVLTALFRLTEGMLFSEHAAGRMPKDYIDDEALFAAAVMQRLQDVVGSSHASCRAAPLPLPARPYSFYAGKAAV